MKDKQTNEIDPAHRIWVPIEKRDVAGRWTFRTSDGDKYVRDTSGAIRREKPKVNGKLAKRNRRKARAAHTND